MKDKCVECQKGLSKKVSQFSRIHFGFPLCLRHQKIISSIESTDETKSLYLALKQQGIPALLEKNDGFKTIDIAIPTAKLNIEVDGQHHNYCEKQSLADLKRTRYSWEKGYKTLRIPNSLIREKLDDAIVEILAILETCGGHHRNNPHFHSSENERKSNTGKNLKSNLKRNRKS